MCATKLAEAVGLDAGSVEDIRTAALLFNMKDLGITNEVLLKAAQVSHEKLQQAVQNLGKGLSKGGWDERIVAAGDPECSFGAAVATRRRQARSRVSGSADARAR